MKALGVSLPNWGDGWLGGWVYLLWVVLVISLWLPGALVTF